MYADIGLLHGKSLVALQRHSEALPVLDALLKIDPNNAEAFALKSVALARTNNVAAARDALSTARRLPLSSPDAAELFREAEQLVREVDSAMAPPLGEPVAPGATPSRERSNRVALVIGNAAYQNVAPLTNSGRDAEALAAEFDALGFRKVTLLRDVAREQMFARAARVREGRRNVRLGCDLFCRSRTRDGRRQLARTYLCAVQD